MNIDLKILTPFAHRYVWWKTPEQAIKTPALVISQVMNQGDFEDVQRLTSHIDYKILRTVLARADARNFSLESWNYWHYRLGLISSEEEPPPLPERRAK